MSASLVFLFVGLAASYLLLRPLATIVHELGHVAMLRLLGQRGALRIYIGSLGVGKGAWRLQMGKWLWLVSPRAVLLRGGLTDYDTPLRGAGAAWVALAGPLASLLLAATMVALALGPWPGALRLLFALAGLIAVMDTLLSIVFRYEPEGLSCGRIHANDGQVMGWGLAYRADLDAYLRARWFFRQDQYADCATAVAALVQRGHHEKLLYEYWMYALLMERKPAEALAVHAQLLGHHPADAYDDCLAALAHELLGDLKATDAALAAALVKAPGHHEALNHSAFRAMQADDPSLAAALLERSIRSHAEFAAARSNRGMLYLVQGRLTEAEADLRMALRLDHENPFVHLGLSRLARAKGDPETAANWLVQAQLLGLRQNDGIND